MVPNIVERKVPGNSKFTGVGITEPVGGPAGVVSAHRSVRVVGVPDHQAPGAPGNGRGSGPGAALRPVAAMSGAMAVIPETGTGTGACGCRRAAPARPGNRHGRPRPGG